MLGTFEEYRAYTRRTQDELQKNVTESVAGMLRECEIKIVNGISSLLTNELGVILGVGKGEEMMRTGYYVLVEYPKIIRCDIAMWNRNISVESLQNRVNNVVACVAYKSEVDVPKLDFNTFLGCYASVLREEFGEEKQKIKEKI